jgi:putative salt-induced outer membrane protein YdiY
MIVLCAGLVAADEIVLEDGSVIVGVVQELKGKRLRVRTKTMGVVRIQRDTIVEIRMERPLTVEFESGERFTGIVAVQDELATITGEAEARTVAASEIRMMEKPQPGVWGRLDVTASGGINVVRGNTLTTSYRVDAGGTFHHDNGRTRGSIATTVNEREGKEDAQRSTFDLAHEYWGLGRFTLDGILNLETNESSDLDLRSIVALATGYKLLRGPVHRLEPIVGMAWVSEDFVGIPVEEGFEGVVGFAYRLRVGPTRFDSDLAVFPFNSDRTLVNYDAKLRFELIYNLDLDITYYDRYNSDPPVAALTRDYGLTIGLGWSN